MSIFREPTNIGMDRCGSCRTLDEFYQTVLSFDEKDGIFLELFPEGKFSNDDSRNAAISAYYMNHKQPQECKDTTDTISKSKNQCQSTSFPKYYSTNLEGAYRFTNKDYCMPQISVYAKTPMRYSLDNTHYRNEKGIHVLNLVGAGFDCIGQPDVHYYMDRTTMDIRSDRRSEFLSREASCLCHGIAMCI